MTFNWSLVENELLLQREERFRSGAILTNR